MEGLLIRANILIAASFWCPTGEPLPAGCSHFIGENPPPPELLLWESSARVAR